MQSAWKRVSVVIAAVAAVSGFSLLSATSAQATERSNDAVIGLEDPDQRGKPY
ncbi:hypothetical protein [Kribbella antibiotica]|uniref:hypothetical protein n=1 Tax=Kribbella antibiotica TaxID=190195 RepID=UPI0014052CC8|nr:hypothetical protein [Kribbella antibiotica]